MKFILLLLVASSFNLLAQDLPGKPPAGEARFERPPGAIECFEELKYCTYLIQNIEKASSLINQVLPILFPNGIIDFDKGHMKQLGNNTYKISFWYEDEIVLGRMKALLMKLDSLEQFSTNAIVEVNTEVYAVTEDALTDLSAQISGVTFGNTETPSASAGNNGVSLSMNVGTATLSALIGAQRAKGTATRISSVTQILQNLDSINYAQVAPIYMPQGSTGIVKEGEIGIRIGGTVTIERDHPDLVNIKNFTFQYNVADPKNPGVIPSLKIGLANMPLQEGVSYALVSNNTDTAINENFVRLIGVGHSRQKTTAKLIVYSTVKTYSYDEFTRNNMELVRKHKTGFFTEEEVSKLKDKSSLSLNEIFSNITLSSSNVMSGDPELRFILDKKLATKENYNKLIKIKVTGDGLNETKFMSLENLMIKPFVLKRMPIQNLNKSLVKLRIKLREKGEHGEESKKVIKAYYNPAISDSPRAFFIRPKK